jgi:hypothetical protein
MNNAVFKIGPVGQGNISPDEDDGEGIKNVRGVKIWDL